MNKHSLLEHVGQIAVAGFFSLTLALISAACLTATVIVLRYVQWPGKFAAIMPFALAGMAGGVFCLWLTTFLQELAR